jgi:hypothetical protein
MSAATRDTEVAHVIQKELELKDRDIAHKLPAIIRIIGCGRGQRQGLGHGAS